MKGPYRGYSGLWFLNFCFLFKGIKDVLFLKNATFVFLQMLLTFARFFQDFSLQDFLLDNIDNS